MNQHQRKFLLDAIEKQYKTELSALNKRKPAEPSLNNYLIAAILDGSFVMRPQADVRELITRRVRSLGKTRRCSAARTYGRGGMATTTRSPR